MDFQLWLNGQCVRQDKRLFNLNSLEIQLRGSAFLVINKEFTSFDLFSVTSNTLLLILDKRETTLVFFQQLWHGVQSKTKNLLYSLYIHYDPKRVSVI